MNTAMLVISLFALTGCDIGVRNPATTPNAKFVLLSGENTIEGTGFVGAPHKRILRMDVETGKTWMLVEGHGPTIWSEIDERYSGGTSK